MNIPFSKVTQSIKDIVCNHDKWSLFIQYYSLLKEVLCSLVILPHLNVIVALGLGCKFLFEEKAKADCHGFSAVVSAVLYLAVYVFLCLQWCPCILFSTLVSVANTDAGQMGTDRIRFHLCMWVKWAISTLALNKVSEDYKPSERDDQKKKKMHSRYAVKLIR